MKKYREIDTNFCGKMKFEVIDLKAKVGDRVWWDDGSEDHHYYRSGIITSIDPDKWWIYDYETPVRTVLGCCEIDVDGEKEKYMVYFKDILTEDPNLEPESENDDKEFTYEVAQLLSYLGSWPKDVKVKKTCPSGEAIDIHPCYDKNSKTIYL